jgi:hypothetical protein
MKCKKKHILPDWDSIIGTISFINNEDLRTRRRSQDWN